MYCLKVHSYFSSAHNLRRYKGKCERLHGHNWKVEAEIRSSVLDKAGMVMDFKDIKSALTDILGRMDHKYLNDLDYFKKANPTSENIARYIYTRLARKVKGLHSVTVWESENASAAFSAE